MLLQSCCHVQIILISVTATYAKSFKGIKRLSRTIFGAFSPSGYNVRLSHLRGAVTFACTDLETISQQGNDGIFGKDMSAEEKKVFNEEQSQQLSELEDSARTWFEQESADYEAADEESAAVTEHDSVSSGIPGSAGRSAPS